VTISCLERCKEPPTNDEIAIASGKKTLNPAKAAKYLVKLKKASAMLFDIFTQKNQKAAVHTCSFTFESALLTEI